MKKYLKAMLLFFVCIFNSCLDFKHVNTFSGTAIETLQSYADIQYSFSRSYNEYTAGRKLFVFTQSEFTSNKFDTRELPVDTSLIALNARADETIFYFINTLTAYFEGISKISGKEFVNFKYNDLADNLKSASAVKAKLRITDMQIDAGANLAKTFSDEIMGKYREKKLREILIKKDAELSLAVIALISCFHNLNETITSDIEILKANYATILAAPSNDILQKLIFKKSYYQDVAELKNKSSGINLLINGIKILKEGHNNIVQEIRNNKLNASAIITLLDNYSNKLFTIYQQIKLLKHITKN